VDRADEERLTRRVPHDVLGEQRGIRELVRLRRARDRRGAAWMRATSAVNGGIARERGEARVALDRAVEAHRGELPQPAERLARSPWCAANAARRTSRLGCPPTIESART
jgi:hypothetical protein